MHLIFIGNSYLAAGGVAFRSVPHMGHFCAVPPGRMLFAIFEFVNGSFVVSFNSSYGSLLCGSWPHARIQKTVADERTQAWWYNSQIDYRGTNSQTGVFRQSKTA